MYPLLKKILFLFPAEKAHHITTRTIKFLFRIPFIKSIFRSIYSLENKNLERTLLGLTFKNPVGLAAGFDKNAEFVHEFSTLGFGFIEIGTVTPLPQPGNPQPRLFRLPKDGALINRMGFNNEGMAVAKANLQHRPNGIIVGGNIGKNKITPNEDATGDYLKCFEELYPVVDYFVVNVSSPNTPDLRKLQDKEPLEALLKSLQEANKLKPAQKPILLKIAPDLTNTQLDDILEIAANINLDGIIANNTTIDRSGLKTAESVVSEIGAGGLSGAPVKERSNEILRYLRAKNQTIPIIAVGGIMSGTDAVEKLNAGANLVQVYSGMIYRGPGLIREINKAILQNV